MHSPTELLIRREDRGAVALLTAILALVLVGMAAFAADFGLAYSRDRQLQNASDGAALAAAKELLDAATPGLSCAAVLAAAQDDAEEVAREYALQAAPQDSALAIGDPPTGWLGDAGVSFRCNPSRLAEVRVATTNASPSFFGGIFGASRYQLSRPATAAMGPATAVVGLRPITFCKETVDALVDNDPTFSGIHQLVTINKVFSSDTGAEIEPTACGDAPGNWGILDFDGGSNPVSDIAKWIDIGYNGKVDLGADRSILFQGDPGFPNPNSGDCDLDDGCKRENVTIEDALNDILGVTSLLPIFDNVDSGAGNTFRVVGFLSVRICGWKIGNRAGVEPSDVAGDDCYLYGGTPETDAVQVAYTPPVRPADPDGLQLQLLDRISAEGWLSTYCGLDPEDPNEEPGAYCDNNPRVTQLIAPE